MPLIFEIFVFRQHILVMLGHHVELLGDRPGDAIIHDLIAVKDLAHVLSEIAVLLEELWQSYGVGHCFAKRRVQVVDMCRIRTKAGQERGSRWSAEGLLTVGSAKDGTALPDSINVGCVSESVAEAAELWPKIVDSQKQNIPLGGGSFSPRLRDC